MRRLSRRSSSRGSAALTWPSCHWHPSANADGPGENTDLEKGTEKAVPDFSETASDLL